MATRAARTAVWEQQNDSLMARHQRMDSLASRLAAFEARQNYFGQLIGIASSSDSAFWLTNRGAVGSDGSGWAKAPRRANGLAAYDSGFVTRSDGGASDHPGIDIAVASGSYVRAGWRRCVDAANDPIYGLFVLIDHGDGWRTRYGHAPYLVARTRPASSAGRGDRLVGFDGSVYRASPSFRDIEKRKPNDPLSMVTPP